MLTPFHLGPGLLLGVLTFRFFNLWAVLLGSIAMDAEPLILLLIGRCYNCPHHGFLHSILGAILGSLILSFFLWIFREKLNLISLKIGISQPFSFKIIFFSSFFAWILHVFSDSIVHYDVFPFWPSHYSPFFVGPTLYCLLNYVFLAIGIFSLFIIYKKLRKKNA